MKPVIEDGGIPWMSTVVGHLPHGEQPIMLDLIKMAMPLLWHIGGDKRLKAKKEGLHVIVTRRGGKCVELGEFRHDTRTMMIDVGAIRSLTLNRWRRRVVGMLAHETMHARQFFRAPGIYQKGQFDFDTHTDYLNDPDEVEARHEEAMVRKALGLKACLNGTRAERLKIDEYRAAFEVELLPFLREVDKIEDHGGKPPMGLPLSKRNVVELLDDLTNYINVRTIRSWDGARQAQAARWWLLARGTMVSQALTKRSEAKNSAWLGRGMVQRSVRAELAKNLPAAAEKLKRELPGLTPHALRSNWDAQFDTHDVLLAGLAKLQGAIEKNED